MQQSMVMADGASKSYVDKKLQESKRLERAHQVTKWTPRSSIEK